AGDLAGDLATDGAAGAGDEDGGPGQVLADLTRVDRGVLAAQEVGYIEVAQVADQGPVDPVGRQGEDLDLRLGAERLVDHRLDLLAGALVDGDEDPVDPVLEADRLQVLDRSQHLEAAHGPSGELQVVVDEADDVDGAPDLGVGQLVGQGRPRAAGTHDDGAETPR